jgi:hypothetical protein
MISGPCHHDIAHPQVAEDRQLTRSNPPVGGVGKGANNTAPQKLTMLQNISPCLGLLCIQEWRDEYKVLVGRPEGKRPLGRHARRCEYNIKMDLQEVGWRAWTGLFWLRIGTGGGLL